MVTYTSRRSLALGVAAFLALSAAATAQNSATATSSSTATTGRMKPVRVIQARVQGD
ncbi:hypothetical protein Gpo141_00013001, partial [Globisporangium polare]